MATVGDTAVTVELALLKTRFPEEAVEDCGRIRSDFFCARRSGGFSYEGRLFVMDRALLFVSTHSNQYDLFISNSNVEQITDVQQGFLPSLTLSLPNRKEVFTNFQNLSGLVELINTLELPPPLLSGQPLAPSIQRMASVPATHCSHYPSVEVCPFFVRSGFCPRRPLCKLDHSPHLHPSSTSQSAKNLTGGPSKISAGSQTKFSAPTILGQPKRFHPMEENEENPLVNSSLTGETVVASTTVTVDTVPTVTVSVPGAKFNDAMRGVTHFRRYVSLPATDLQRDTERPRPAKTDPMTSSSLLFGGAGGGVERCESSERSLLPRGRSLGGAGGDPGAPGDGGEGKSAKQPDNQMMSLESEVQGVSPLSSGSSPVVPEVFDFYRTEGGREGMFVFTASPSKTGETGEVCEDGDEVRSKSCVLVRPGEGEDGNQQNEMVAELAQQLQLDSDNDSIHGDLDLDTQRKILDSLSPHRDQESGPSHRATGHQQSSPVKRRPCVYFLSGSCRNGISCPDYHGLDFDPCELEDAQESDAGVQEPAALPKEVKVYHADHTHISSGDKIILSSEVLVACEQQHLSYPVAFKLTHPTSGQAVYCGVLQFTAPSSDSAHLPSWMMEHLQACNGDTVSFSHVDLPKGTFVRLQPVSSAWLGIPCDKRMAMMEFQLRNFQTLTEGTKVTLTYELNRYTLKVLQCKPAKGISILNADITTDITEPADLSRFHSVVEGQAEHIGLDETVTCSVTSGSYRHFVLLSLPGKPLPERVSVEVKTKRGDPDLFLCQTCTAPSQSRYTWCSQEVGDSSIHLCSTDNEDYDVEKPLYAGVVSLCEDAEFSISFRDTPLATTPPGVGQSPGGQKLRDSPHLPKTTPTSKPESLSSPSLSSEEVDGPSVPAGHERCPTCGSVMPSLRLVMHQRHCAVSTFICPHCRAALPKVAEKKHKYIAHDLLVCACGLEYTQFALHRHQKTDCSKRTVPCQFKWCNLSFPMDQLMNHESLCGRKKISCCLCQEEVSQLEMAIHLEAFHSVDTRDLDWRKPLQKQDLESRVSKPQFSCGCGLGFEFMDDMEVHQLTDCPLRRLAENQPISSTKGEIVG